MQKQAQRLSEIIAALDRRYGTCLRSTRPHSIEASRSDQLRFLAEHFNGLTIHIRTTGSNPPVSTKYPKGCPAFRVPLVEIATKNNPRAVAEILYRHQIKLKDLTMGG